MTCLLCLARSEIRQSGAVLALIELQLERLADASLPPPATVGFIGVAGVLNLGMMAGGVQSTTVVSNFSFPGGSAYKAGQSFNVSLSANSTHVMTSVRVYMFVRG
jgi:hypothetical protein